MSLETIYDPRARFRKRLALAVVAAPLLALGALFGNQAMRERLFGSKDVHVTRMGPCTVLERTVTSKLTGRQVVEKFYGAGCPDAAGKPTTIGRIEREEEFIDFTAVSSTGRRFVYRVSPEAFVKLLETTRGAWVEVPANVETRR